jgi:transcriptional regulator with XRE-family HTH domain
MTRKLPVPDESAPALVRTLADLGRLVRNQRAHARLRIDDAASLSLVSSDLLSRLENGKPVTLDKLMLVLDGLGLRMLVVPAREVHKLETALLPPEASARTTHG